MTSSSKEQGPIGGGVVEAEITSIASSTVLSVVEDVNKVVAFLAKPLSVDPIGESSYRHEMQLVWVLIHHDPELDESRHGTLEAHDRLQYRIAVGAVTGKYNVDADSWHGSTKVLLQVHKIQAKNLAAPVDLVFLVAGITITTNIVLQTTVSNKMLH